MPHQPTQSHLERYELQDRIAVGGMAEVYRAKAYGDHGFEKDLAIKRILPELAADPEFEDRFIGEAKLAVKLTHANVVQVLDFGRFGGTLFIAMEYVDGLDLAALLKHFRERGERIPLPAAFHIAVEIARGLDFAHQHKVVHRDVSPSNILLSRAGEVKIADFGIAQPVSTKREDPGSKRRIMGKWRYMSPEQTRGENLSTQSDLFSAAAVIYEVFTGDKLFPGDEAEEIIDNIHRMELPKPSEQRSGLPARLDAVLANALERRPQDRPRQSTDMLRALIEVSYESSMVATALDVAEVVQDVLRSRDQERERVGGIDALIRQQVGAAMAVADARRTAVGETVDEPGPDVDAPADTESGRLPTGSQTGATVVRKGVDEDGVTLWEVNETIAAAPSAIRSGRRPTSGDGAYTRDGESSSRSHSTTHPAGGRRARPLGLLAGTALAVAAIVTAGVLASSSNKRKAPSDRGPAVAVTQVADAGLIAAIDAGARPGTLYLDSVPRGAQVRVDGNLLSDTTPVETTVAPGEPHRVEISLDGYRTIVDDEVVLGAGERLRLRPALVKLKAALDVITRPAGATVTLAGETLGETPITRTDLAPGSQIELVISKPDYHPITLAIDLRADERKVINRKLRSSLRYGRINLRVRAAGGGRSWADVYFKGKNIGQATGTFRLPVGRHKLRLVNPTTRKSGSVWVNVRDDRVETFTVDL